VARVGLGGGSNTGGVGGSEHRPNVARDLNSLAQLLQATDRLAEAGPPMRRDFDIFERFNRAIGHEHRAPALPSPQMIWAAFSPRRQQW
jgi:hypothetical protein